MRAATRISTAVAGRLAPRAAVTARRAALVPTFRHFSDTPASPAAAFKHGSREAQSSVIGQPISEDAKQDETKLSGLSHEGDQKPPPLAQRSTSQLFSLKGQTVIISGGGRGLGLTVAQAVLDAGAHVAAVDLLPQPSSEEWSVAEETAKRHGTSISYTRLDVVDQSAVADVFKTLFDQAPAYAPVRGLFTSAGIQLLKAAVDITPEQIRKIFDVNLTGSFLCAQAFAREYIQRNPDEAIGHPAKGEQLETTKVDETRLAGAGGGSIVFTGSMSGSIANFGLDCAAYNASKAGVNQLARNLAMEWGPRGIRVNSLSPGYIRTAMTAALLDERPDLNEIWLRGSLLGRLSTPDEFRGPVVFLLSDASSFITGTDLKVDGGHTAT